MVGFGPHLIFDGYRCPAQGLSDLNHLYRVLDTLPNRIQMTKIMPPYVLKHGEPGAEGLSGFVLIAESHISIHTFPARGFVNADVFSCSDFDVEQALAELRRAFSPRRTEWKLLDRGTEFPKHIGGARAQVAQQRKRMAKTMGLEVTR
ncbi:MAG TPA: adenosylmethionine decarboxylase [Candidatus Limnocylindria bacterium]|nr:adenosylmethionine decarboxylase [Candidatus Limnocylindria bacterium]